MLERLEGQGLSVSGGQMPEPAADHMDTHARPGGEAAGSAEMGAMLGKEPPRAVEMEVVLTEEIARAGAGPCLLGAQSHRRLCLGRDRAMWHKWYA